MSVLRSLFRIALGVVLSLPALAQDTLSYQGTLVDAARRPVTASYPMVFALYANREGGEPLWSESYDSVDVIDGSFNVELGSLTPLTDELARSPRLFLGISVNDAVEMAPRTKVSSTLRARWAAHAKDVRGENIHPATVSIGETEVIKNKGMGWEPSGLREDGADGAPGARGPQGPVGPTGDRGGR